MKFNYTWEEVEREGRLYDIELMIHYHVTPYRPAKIHCDPDDGHPEEGGDVEIDDIEVLSVEMIDVGMIKTVSKLEKLYWADRFLKNITDDFKMELAAHKASWDEGDREDESDRKRERNL